jgi:hypothetical protein
VRTRTYLLSVALALLTVACTGCGAGWTQSSSATTPATGNSKKAGPYTISLAGAPNPAVRGDNTVDVTITDSNGQPVADAKVILDFDMTTMSHGKNVVTATPAGNGRYTGRVTYMMAGPWRVIVTLERAGQAPVSVRFDFSVNLR